MTTELQQFPLEYRICCHCMQVDSGKINEVFPTGRNLDPLMVAVGEDRLALNKDNISVLIDHKRQPTQK